MVNNNRNQNFFAYKCVLLNKIEHGSLNTTKTTSPFTKYSSEFEILPSYKYKNILQNRYRKNQKHSMIRKIL